MQFDEFVDLFEHYLDIYDELNELPVEARNELYEVLSQPFTMDYLTVMAFISPYPSQDKPMIQLLEWLEYSASEFVIFSRQFTDEAEASLQELNAVLRDIIAGPDFAIEQAYHAVKILRDKNITIAADIISALQANQLENAESSILTAEQSAASFNNLIHEMGITNAEEFVLEMSSELGMLPMGGTTAILGLVHHFEWGMDAGVLLLTHNNAMVVSEASDFLNTQSAKEWGHLKNKQYLNVIRHFVDDELRNRIDSWSKHAMRYSHHVLPSCEVVDMVASIPDGQNASCLAVLIQEGESLHMFACVFRLDLGLVDQSYRPNISSADWENMVKVLQEHSDARHVNTTYLSSILPWAMSIQQENQQPPHFETLQFLSMLPQAWCMPQAANFLDIITANVTDLSEQEIESSRLIGDVLPRYLPLINTWTIQPLPQGAKTVRNVINRGYLSERHEVIQKLVLAGLVSSSSEHVDQHITQILMQNAYALLTQDLKRKKLPLLEHLSNLSITQDQEFILMKNQNTLKGQKGKGYVIKVELLESKPSVWRRFTVSNQMDLLSFHMLIQDVMGWENEHLFEFTHGQKNYRFSEEGDMTLLESIPLGALLCEPDDSMLYTYDFGDCWEHKITLEKIQKADCDIPKVTAGRNACPPEDCGGVFCYEQLLKANRRRNTDDLELLEDYGWLEEELTPSVFNKDEVNAVIRSCYEEL
ncbi:plasmid pRiA4b ORF-3 family protein [Vibrio sp. Of7-15]|uniref:plasmid pRiA4b ORF-3 family protein n=1 Tax=Vibrio sp. Of7-15 TaxID=2724879 RepID=UPI001EF26175|nr:plasmid pRiA4b ORF-3 family protein [Vibrio sp. Of7-15]